MAAKPKKTTEEIYRSLITPPAGKDRRWEREWKHLKKQKSRKRKSRKPNHE